MERSNHVAETGDTLSTITDFRPGALMNSLYQGVPAESVAMQVLSARNIDWPSVYASVNPDSLEESLQQPDLVEKSTETLLELQHDLDRQRAVYAGLTFALKAYVASHALLDFATSVLNPRRTWAMLQRHRDEVFDRHGICARDDTPGYNGSIEEEDFTSVMAARHADASIAVLAALTEEDEGFERTYNATRWAYTYAHNGVRHVVGERRKRDAILENDEQRLFDELNAGKIDQSQLTIERARLFGCSTRAMLYEAPTEVATVTLERLEKPIGYRVNARLAAAIIALAIHTQPRDSVSDVNTYLFSEKIINSFSGLAEVPVGALPVTSYSSFSDVARIVTETDAEQLTSIVGPKYPGRGLCPVQHTVRQNTDLPNDKLRQIETCLTELGAETPILLDSTGGLPLARVYGATAVGAALRKPGFMEGIKTRKYVERT